jgi:hypothetical protein
MTDTDRLQAKVEVLLTLVQRAQSLLDPCYPTKVYELQEDARAALQSSEDKP